MNAVVVSTIMLAMALAASGEGPERAQPMEETSPIKIDVAYTKHGNLQYYSLQAASYQSQFTLHYYEYLRRPQPGEAQTRFLVFKLPGSAGRELTAAFSGLNVSWNPSDYWFRVPEDFADLPLEHLACGMVAFGAHQLLTCPVSSIASARQSTQANNLAWFVELLELTRYRFSESSRSAEAEESKNMLLGLLQNIGGGKEVEVGKDGAGAGRQIPVGLILRTAVAQALVYGGLLAAPISCPEFEIRQAAVQWYAEHLPQEDARRALLQALGDGDSHIRAAAATALAAEVARNDSATITAIRNVLQRERDPLVRQVIHELLEGATAQPERPKDRGSD